MARPPKREKGLYTRKDASGVLWWYYRLYFNKVEQRGGPYSCKTDAKAKRDDLKSDHRHARLDPDGERRRLDDVLDQHVRDRAKKKDQASQRRFCAWWKARFKAAGIRQVKDLKVSFLEAVRNELAHKPIKLGPTPRSGPHTKRKPSVGKLAEAVGKVREGSTVNRYFRWLQASLGSVKQTQRQLFDHWQWESEGDGRTRYLNDEEEAALLIALGPTYGSWMRLAILTGLRMTEQFTLAWRQVDLEQQLLTLPTTKSGATQYAHLSTEATDILRTFDSWQRSKWVFPSENPATSLDTRNFFKRTWAPAVKRAGIEWVRWHDLRHTFASRLAMAGKNDQTIATCLRHSTTALVKRYAHLSPSHLKAAVEAVARFGKSSAQDGSGDSGGETGKKPETQGSEGERNGQPKAAEVGGVEGEKIGAPDTN